MKQTNHLPPLKLDDTFAFMEDVTICGMNQDEHDFNLAEFRKVAQKRHLTLNEAKCTYSVTSLNILGYHIENGDMKPDPECLRPLKEIPLPHTSKSLKRVIGLFSYYSHWIPNFSDKIAPLVKSNTFPLNKEAQEAFDRLKLDIEDSVVRAIDESLPFEIETDASDIALAAVLNQGGRPVAFYSRTLHGSELGHPSVEKEACAIIEAVRHWRHYLTDRRFTLKTDQKSVSYMFEKNHKGRIKNDKINRWRVELSCYNFDISYRPGKDNIPADTFTRVYCSVISTDTLFELHKSLCHPGITRMSAFVRSRNLPFSVVRKLTNSCLICNECKPRFHRPDKTHLIKATQPFERLNIDFKGPLPSTSRTKYMLTVVDEFSRFPFAFPYDLCHRNPFTLSTICLIWYASIHAF